MRENVQGFGWYVRRSPDSPKLSAFYRDVVGLPVLRSSPTVTMFWSGESTVFEVNTGGAPTPGYTDRIQSACTPVFRVRGFEDALGRIQASGATVINDMAFGASRLVYFLDPDGNVSGIQERERESPRAEDQEADRRWDAGAITMEGAGSMPSHLQGLGWVVFRVQDVEKEVAFYRDVVGLDLARTPDSPTHAMFDLNDTVIFEVASGGTPQPIPTDRVEINDTFIVRVWDLDGIVADLKSKGVHFVNEIFPITCGRLAYFVDPEGHVMGLQQRTPDSERVEDFEAIRRWEARQK